MFLLCHTRCWHEPPCAICALRFDIPVIGPVWVPSWPLGRRGNWNRDILQVFSSESLHKDTAWIKIFTRNCDLVNQINSDYSNQQMDFTTQTFNNKERGNGSLQRLQLPMCWLPSCSSDCFKTTLAEVHVAGGSHHYGHTTFGMA